MVSRLSSPTTRASAAAPRRRGSVDRNVNANRIYRGQLFRFLWRTTSLNQHYFAFLTIRFSRIHCWVGPNRSGPYGDPIGPFREASGFAAVGGGHLAALDSRPSACGQQKGSRRGHRRPQVLVCVWGTPLSRYQLPKWRACPELAEIWRFFCAGSVRQSSTKDPGKPGPVELQPKKMGQVRLEHQSHDTADRLRM